PDVPAGGADADLVVAGIDREPPARLVVVGEVLPRHEAEGDLPLLARPQRGPREAAQLLERHRLLRRQRARVELDHLVPRPRSGPGYQATRIAPSVSCAHGAAMAEPVVRTSTTGLPVACRAWSSRSCGAGSAMSVRSPPAKPG